MGEPLPPKILLVPHGSPLYQAAVVLRSRVLREPLGLAFTPEQLAAEKQETHWVALDAQRVVGSVSVAPAAEGAMRLRQMAVDPAFQGHGIGRHLLRQAEAFCRQAGVRRITLHARMTAVGFYEKEGFQVVGGTFSEVTIPHCAMEKLLRSESPAV